MEFVLVSSYLRAKLSSTLKEAEADPSSPSQIISRIRSIESRISSVSVTADLLYDLIDALSECRIFAQERRKEAASKKGSYIFRLMLFERNMGSRLEAIEKVLENSSPLTVPTVGGLKIQQTYPDVPDPSVIVGFEAQVKEIEDLLLSNSSSVAGVVQEENGNSKQVGEGEGSSFVEGCEKEDKDNIAAEGFTAIGIFGRCGSGKTALAQKVFASRRIQEAFSPRIWVCLSDVLSDSNPRVKILNYILGKIGYDVAELRNHRVFELLEKLECGLMGKRFLIVLDDAWRMDEFYADLGSSVCVTGESFASGLPKGSGGAVIVTGRGENVIRRMVGDEHVMRPRLGDDICWDILCDAVKQQGNIDVLDDIVADMADDVARNCDGLPLAAKTLANVIPYSRPKTSVPSLQDLPSRLMLTKGPKTLVPSLQDLPSRLMLTKGPKTSVPFLQDLPSRLMLTEGYLDPYSQ